MRHWMDLSCLTRAGRHLALFGCLALAAFVAVPHATYAQEQDENTRVMWQIRYADGLSKAQKNEVQNTLLSILARVRERHFAAPNIISQKLKSEGLQMPSCFEDGGPCASGSSFLLDVHQVDVYVDALFDYKNDQWTAELKLYRRLSASTAPIFQSGKNLNTLLNNIVGSLFTLESSIDVTSNVPDVQVYLNSKLIGTTPLSMKITEGAQKLVFKKDGYFDSTWEFNAQKGAVHAHEVELKPETTQFTIFANDPDATVLVDGDKWGKIGEMREILPGEHKIEFQSEKYAGYEQNLMIYSGNPQTMQVSLRPNSRDPLEMRHEGISRYRFSATAGYQAMFESFSLNDQERSLGGYSFKPGANKGSANTRWASTSFHGMSFAFNYEAEYWGITIARVDLLGSAIDDEFGLFDSADDSGYDDQVMTAKADGATLINFYPAQFKAHYTFWVMQAELQAGVGLSWLKLRSHITGINEGYSETWLDDNDVEHRFKDQDIAFDRLSFSVNLNLAMKYFFSEESFLMLAYNFQLDALKNHEEPVVRNGFTLNFGYQIPLLMRDKKSQQALDEGIMLDEQAMNELMNQTDVATGEASNTKIEPANLEPAPSEDSAAPVVNDADDDPAPVVLDEDEVPVSWMSPIVVPSCVSFSEIAGLEEVAHA